MIGSTKINYGLVNVLVLVELRGVIGWRLMNICRDKNVSFKSILLNYEVGVVVHLDYIYLILVYFNLNKMQ